MPVREVRFSPNRSLAEQPRVSLVFLLASGCSSGESDADASTGGAPGKGGASDGMGGASNTGGSDPKGADNSGGTKSDAPVVTEPEPEPARVCADLDVESSGVFVSAVGGTDQPEVGTCGSPQLPCKTIGRALVVAEANARSIVYVASGDYHEDITVSFPVTIQGGWSEVGGIWKPICTNDRSSRVVVNGVEEAAVSIKDVAGEVELDSLTFEGPDRSQSDGESSYGVFARGDELSLVLREVIVHAGDGGNGTDGSPWTGDDSQARHTWPYPEDCESGNGKAGADGELGKGGTMGAFSAEGYAPGDGTPGGKGKTGNNGLPAQEVCGECAAGFECKEDPCEPVKSDTTCITGKSGCGGIGGEPGNPGRGGGGSFGVYVWDAAITIRGSRLTAASGGSGGDGQLGQQGGYGTHGDEVAAFCITCVEQSGTCQPHIGEFDVEFGPVGLRSPGTKGGLGGDGGPSGGGLGGPSFALWLSSEAKAAVSTDSVLEHGEPSAGGGAATDKLHGSKGQTGKIGPL